LSYEDDVIFGMEAYFESYRKRFPHRSAKDAVRATKNWAEGLIKAFRGGFIDPMALEKIGRRLNELGLT